MRLTTVADVLRRTAPGAKLPVLSAPDYAGERSGNRIGMAVESMRRHMTDEGWQLFAGLEHAGYTLTGKRLPVELLDARHIVDRLQPGTVVMQDKREWDRSLPGFRDKTEHYENVPALQRPNIFRVTVLKDAHQRPPYHRESAEELGCHAWITYYHPAIVSHLATYVRPQHLIRTYHSIDKDAIPVGGARQGVLLSGAVSGAYPLRKRLVAEASRLHAATVLKHPGYHANGSNAPEFLKTLTRFRVAICTASTYGYVLRKMVEATACGCVVVTDLPVDEVVPEIDGNLIRVSPDISIPELNKILRRLCDDYSPGRQADYAERAKRRFDYRVQGQMLADDIEKMRSAYACSR